MKVERLQTTCNPEPETLCGELVPSCIHSSQSYKQVCHIKCWHWKGTSTDLHPLPCMTDWRAQSGWGSPGSAPSLPGCRGCGYVNSCSTVWVCFVSALEGAGCQLQSGNDVARISMVPREFIVHSALLLSLFVPITPYLLPMELQQEGERTFTITQLKFKVKFNGCLKNVKEWILLLASSFNQRSNTQQQLTLKQFWNLLLTRYRAIGLMQEFSEAMLMPM